MTDDPEGRSLVGYKRPPVAYRFQKGASGNPSGRPAKKACPITYQSAEAQMDQILLREMMRLVPITENGQTTHMPMMQVIVRSMSVSAAKGNHKSAVALIKLQNDFHDQWFDILTQTHQASLRYKKSWEAEIDYSRTHGLAIPNPSPHPAEMISMEGELIYNGPQSEAEKATWDNTRALLAEFKQANNALEIEAAQAQDPSLHEHEIASNRRMIDMFDALCPDEETRRQPGFNLQRYRERWPGYRKFMADGAKRQKRRER